MVKLINILFCIIIAVTIYLVKYESYTWDPCSYDEETGLGYCLSIYCPLGQCRIPAEVTICRDIQCVKDKLKERGTAHLTQISEVTIQYDGKVTAKQLKPISSYDLK